MSTTRSSLQRLTMPLGLTGLMLLQACANVPANSPALAPSASVPTPAPAPTATPPQSSVFLATLDLAAGSIGPARNITNHPGYNNQPAFVNDGSAVLFVSDRSGTSNVYRYDIRTNATTAITATTESLYSPIPLPPQTNGAAGFSAVRVVTPNANGAESKQPAVWRFGWDGQPVEALTDKPLIGYYAWVNARWAAYFIVDSDAQRNAHTAVLADRVSGQTRLLTNKPGRSLGRTPDGQRASFVDKRDPKRWVIAAMGPDDAQPVVLVETLAGPAGSPEADRSEDYGWLPDGSVLMAQGTKFYRWDGKPGRGFVLFADVGDLGGPIKRMAVSADGQRIAFVVQRAAAPR